MNHPDGAIEEIASVIHRLVVVSVGGAGVVSDAVMHGRYRYFAPFDFLVFAAYVKNADRTCDLIFEGSVWVLILIILPDRSVLSCKFDSLLIGLGRGGSSVRSGSAGGSLGASSVSVKRGDSDGSGRWFLLYR